MISPPVAAAIVGACVAAFFAVNIGNVVWGSRKRRGIERRAELRPPNAREVRFVLVGLATFLLFAFCGLYFVLAFFGLQEPYPLGLMQLSQPELVRIAGVLFFAAGSVLFIWSVLARGRYSVSWAMPVDQKLVTWGPYRYIRHPSYTGYFLMFIGLFLSWFNLLAAVPLLGIPGYVSVSQKEDQMLALRFGSAFSEYQKRTGRFLPKL